MAKVVKNSHRGGSKPCAAFDIAVQGALSMRSTVQVTLIYPDDVNVLNVQELA
jgi:hypothetical protein